MSRGGESVGERATLRSRRRPRNGDRGRERARRPRPEERERRARWRAAAQHGCIFSHPFQLPPPRSRRRLSSSSPVPRPPLDSVTGPFRGRRVYALFLSAIRPPTTRPEPQPRVSPPCPRRASPATGPTGRVQGRARPRVCVLNAVSGWWPTFGHMWPRPRAASTRESFSDVRASRRRIP